MGSTASQTLASLHAIGVDRLAAQTLLLHALGRDPYDRTWLVVHGAEPLPEPVVQDVVARAQRYAGGEPLAYLIGQQAFYGLSLQVDARVLVPRPDTETLVDWALECLSAIPAPQVIDLGTGSGAIALALAQQRPDAQVLATDLSTEALALARANALRLHLHVQWHHGDWWHGASGRFHLVASNPPYIALADPHLSGLRHEPALALTSGSDGLDAIRAIVNGAPDHLVPGGWLLLEHGYDQAAAVRALLQAQGFGSVTSRRDLAGIERCTGGVWPG